jgi:hypothetical protein
MPYYRADESDFKLWLSQPVWIDDSKERRGTVLREFYDSVTMMLKKKGYIMDSRWNSKTNPLTNWMYRISVEEYAKSNHNSPVYIPAPGHRDTREDYDYFNHVIDIDTIHSFMDEWSSAEDLDTSSRLGYRVRYELHDFLYNFLDLERSKHGKVIARFWDDSGSDSDEGGRDVYLRDASDGFHGGRGSKV